MCVCARFRRRYPSDLLHIRMHYFSKYQVVFGGTHLESNFVTSHETSVCMSIASVESTVREGFDASARSVTQFLICGTSITSVVCIHYDPFRNLLDMQELEGIL